MRRVVGRRLDRLPHRRRRPDDAVEPGRDDHLDDRPDAAALLADERRPGVVELDLVEAFERSPSLSLSRRIRKPLRVPSGRTPAVIAIPKPSDSFAASGASSGS
jgi:hypothetical protein